jgi:hypothetical protein
LGRSPRSRRPSRLFLSGHAAAALDAAIDAVEPFHVADDPAAGGEPEPFCARCGAPVAIFPQYGFEWSHYRGDGLVASPAEVYDAGHEPVVDWRPAGLVSPCE